MWQILRCPAEVHGSSIVSLLYILQLIGIAYTSLVFTVTIFSGTFRLYLAYKIGFPCGFSFTCCHSEIHGRPNHYNWSSTIKGYSSNNHFTTKVMWCLLKVIFRSFHDEAIHYCRPIFRFSERLSS